jgi:hypothetical protein
MVIYLYDHNEPLYQNVDPCFAFSLVNCIIYGIGVFMFFPYMRLKHPRRDVFARKLVHYAILGYIVAQFCIIFVFASSNVNISTRDTIFIPLPFDKQKTWIQSLGPNFF